MPLNKLRIFLKHVQTIKCTNKLKKLYCTFLNLSNILANGYYFDTILLLKLWKNNSVTERKKSFKINLYIDFISKLCFNITKIIKIGEYNLVNKAIKEIIDFIEYYLHEEK